MENVVSQLLQMQQEIGEIKGAAVSDGEFARQYLPFSESSWSRLKAEKYGADTKRLLVKAEQALEELPVRIDALRRAQASGSTFVRTTLARAVLASVQAARDSVDRRIVPVLAPTGFGKSCIGEYLSARGAIGVNGRQAWQSSYKAFCLDVCAAAGPHMPASTSEASAEAEMIRRLKVKGSGILYVDEANSVGPAFANGIKLIHNETGFTIVVAAVPGPWDKFVARAEEEVRQVINRCQPVIRASRILEGDAKPFLAGCMAPEILSKVVADAVQVANVLGGFKVLKSIVDAVKDIGTPTLDDVQKAIESERRNIAASGVTEARKGGAK
jgi:hypothetical protein